MPNDKQSRAELVKRFHPKVTPTGPDASPIFMGMEPDNDGVWVRIGAHWKALAEIEALEAENARLLRLCALPDKERRQAFLTDAIETQGWFNRSDLVATFGISVLQASVDIRNWNSANPGAAVYNASSKRYQRARSALSPERDEHGQG